MKTQVANKQTVDKTLTHVSRTLREYSREQRQAIAHVHATGEMYLPILDKWRK